MFAYLSKNILSVVFAGGNSGDDCRSYWHGNGSSGGVWQGSECAVSIGVASPAQGAGVEVVLGLSIADGHEGGENLKINISF